MSDDLEELAYRELKAVAGALFRRERPGHTLQPTALVHEAWLKIAKSGIPNIGTPEGRRRFIGIAAHAMRQLLVDHARAHSASKRGGDGWKQVTLAGELPVAELNADLMIDLDTALSQIAARDERVAMTAELFLFGGMPLTEVAEYHGITAKAARAEWALARAVLSKHLA